MLCSVEIVLYAGMVDMLFDSMCPNECVVYVVVCKKCDADSKRASVDQP